MPVLRGIHYPNTQNLRLISHSEAEALGWMGCSCATIFDYQVWNGHHTWFQAQAARGMIFVVRMTGVQPYEEPAALREGIRQLVRLGYRRIQVANEPNLEWPSWDTAAFLEWCRALIPEAERIRDEEGRLVILYFPPLAQDHPDPARHHAAIYDACAGFLLNEWFAFGHELAWHEYWQPGDQERRIDLDMPQAVQQVLPSREGAVTECGRLPESPDLLTGLIDELTARYGSSMGQREARSPARFVMPWLLGSEDPAFEPAAWVDRQGNWRQIVYDWGVWGP